MKKIYRTISAAVLILAAAACTGHLEDQTVPNADENLVEVTFDAALENNLDSDAASSYATKTTYANRAVFWEESDKINIFSGANWVKTEAGISSLTEDRKLAVFSGLAVEGSGTYCAVYPANDANAFNGTSLTVNIPTEQVAVKTGFQTGANVSVAYTNSNSFSFRNVGALIGFRFKTAGDASKTASVTFKGRSSNEDATQYYGIAGTSTVTFDEAGVPVASEGSAGAVTLVAPEGGFEAAQTYYVVVLPGNYKGFDITYTTTDGKTVEKSNDTDYELLRNGVMNIGQLSEPYDTLPDEFEVKVSFTGDWPFNEAIKAAADQVNSGGGRGDHYTYTHQYQYHSTTESLSLNFYIYGNGGNYRKDKSYLLMTAGKNSRIAVSSLPNRYLKSIKIEVNNSSSYPKDINILKGDTSSLLTGYKASKDSPVVITFPVGEIVTELDKIYYIQFPSASTQLTGITLTYSKTL